MLLGMRSRDGSPHASTLGGGAGSGGVGAGGRSHHHHHHHHSTPSPGAPTSSPLATGHHHHSYHHTTSAPAATSSHGHHHHNVHHPHHQTPGGAIADSMTAHYSNNAYLSSPAKLDFLRKKGLGGDQKSSKKPSHRSPLPQKRGVPDLSSAVSSSGGAGSGGGGGGSSSSGSRHRSSSNPDNGPMPSPATMSVGGNDSGGHANSVYEDAESFANSPGYLTMGSAGPPGSYPTGGSSEGGLDDADGTQVDVARTNATITKLKHKIQRTMEQIKDEQDMKEENVNEYLRLADNAEKQQQQQRIKTVFEKKNQKSTQTISMLQRKLEQYKNQLHEVELYGVTSHRPPKEMLKDMGQGLRGVVDNIKGAKDTIVSKPKEFAHLIKNKFGSADNINNLKQLEDGLESTGETSDKQPSTLPTNFKYSSDDDGVSDVTSGSAPSASGTQSSPRPPTTGGPGSTHNSTILSDQRLGLPSGGGVVISGAASDTVYSPASLPPSTSHHHHHHPHTVHQPSATLQHQYLDPVLKKMDLFSAQQEHLQSSLEALKSQVTTDYAYFKQALEEERFRNERLEEQLNDFSELHQHEVTNIKQELQSMEEKMEYQLEERTRDMQELLETCQTRITKMELQQQQQQLISMEGFENSPLRGILTKIINVILALLAVILVVVSTVPSLLGPFFTTRLRGLTSIVIIAICVAVYQKWDSFSLLMDDGRLRFLELLNRQ